MSAPIAFGSPAWAWGTVGLGCALLAAAIAHAALARWQGLPAPVQGAIRRTGQADLCLTPYDDLRHPGWGRDEQSRASSPELVDPRAAAWFVRPVPWKARP